ncbi:site-specific integrase, partial [Streptomyces sp. NPDC006386]
MARDVLGSLRRKLDRGEAAVETMLRKRKVLVRVLHFAVERGELGSHPLEEIRWRCPSPVWQWIRGRWSPLPGARSAQRRLLRGVYRRARGRRLVGFFAGMYYAGLRPEDGVAVALPDCRLPGTGRGRLILHRTLPQAGKRWTDTGRYHDERGLKNRPPGETRVMPLPPHLVALWRESVATFGTADDGRLFLTEQGRIISYNTYHRVWHGLCPASRARRHPAREASVRLAALGAVYLTVCGHGPGRGRPAGRQQRRGLLSRYAKCLYDRQSIKNQRIEELLSAYDQPPEPDEQDEEFSRAGLSLC